MGARNTRSTTIEVPAEQAETFTALLALLGAPAQAAPKVTKANKAKVSTTRMSKDAFRALKAAGVVPYGMTQKEAHAKGLLGVESNGEPKVRTRKVAAKKPAKKTTTKPKSTKGKSGAKAKANTTSWGKSFSAMARTSGLYVNTSETRRATWESIYSVAVQQDWPGVVALRDSDLSPKDAFEEYQARLVANGHEVEHYSVKPAIAKVRDQHRAAFAERVAS